MLNILEVVIGLAFVFAFVSLISSMVNEWLAGVLAMRGRMLWRGVRDLLGQQLGNRVHEHPLVAGLKHPTWFSGVRRLLRLDEASPSYVPTETFVLGLMASLDQAAELPTQFESLQEAVQKVENPSARQALVTLVDNAAGDLANAKQAIGDWFDTSMNEVSGWYKRWTQLMLLMIALLISAALGIDSVQIAEELWTNDEIREGVVSAAIKYLEDNPEVLTAVSSAAAATDPADPGPAALAIGAAALTAAADVAQTDPTTRATGAAASTTSSDSGPADSLEPGDAATDHQEIAVLIDQLENLGLPFASLAEAKRDDPDSSAFAVFRRWIASHFLGFLLTGLAASLGAPFWFDLLSRIVNLRAGYKHAS